MLIGKKQVNSKALYSHLVKSDWCTPPEFLSHVRNFDNIGLDPCANAASVVNAKHSFDEISNGLSQNWGGHGLVFVNPPYDAMKEWSEKICKEAILGTEIILLVNARTETKWFHALAKTRPAICLIAGRLRFINPHSDHLTTSLQPKAPIPSLVMYFGSRNERFYYFFNKIGYVARSF